MTHCCEYKLKYCRCRVIPYGWRASVSWATRKILILSTVAPLPGTGIYRLPVVSIWSVRNAKKCVELHTSSILVSR